jgi:hypothetical protein
MNKRSFDVKKVPGGYTVTLREFKKVERNNPKSGHVTKWVPGKSKTFKGKAKDVRHEAVEFGRDWCRGEKTAKQGTTKRKRGKRALPSKNTLTVENISGKEIDVPGIGTLKPGEVAKARASRRKIGAVED